MYYAGHGCADVKQYFVLNGDTVNKIFWPVEYFLRLLGKKSRGAAKIFVVYDCCREDYGPLRQKVIKALEQYNAEE